MQSLPCYFYDASNQRKSKGLFQIALELKFDPPLGVKLVELRQMLSYHPAFQNVINFE